MANTPIANKKTESNMRELFLLDKFFKSVNPGPHRVYGRRVRPWVEPDENDY